MASPRRKVAINGKFLSGVPTGVHRVAEELIRNAMQIVREDAAVARRLELTLFIPRNATENAERARLPFKVIGPLTGNAWEQLTLPMQTNGQTVLSLCNVGPLLARNAVTMFHDAQVHLAPDSYSRPFRMWYHFHQPISGRRHRKILTVSHFSREQLGRADIAAQERIAVVHNGVDHVFSTEPDDTVINRLGLADTSYVVALANTQPHKNIGLLFHAFSRPELERITLVLFGSASRQDFVAAGHRVPGNVMFAGRVTDAELRSLYAHALCLAFPSLTEGFGLPPLEAMTTACPAIVAPHGALPEVCGSAALYAAGDDPGQWVHNILRLQNDPAFRLQVQEASVRQSGLFTWKRAANQLVQELLKL